MIASLVWKEYREHRAVWIAMTVLAVVSLPIAVELLLPQGWKDAAEDNAVGVVAIALILTGMYGLVCGAMMFAGERESRGMALLEIMPLGRGQLWSAKCLIGMVLVLVYAAVVAAVGRVIGLLGDGAIPRPWAMVLPLVGLEAFAWGLCTSTYCRTVLSAVAFAALLPLLVLWAASGMCLAMMIPTQGGTAGPESLVVFFLLHAFTTLVALGVSCATFVDRDFEKRFVLKPTTSSYGTVAPKRQPRAYEVLVWLALKQGGVLIGVLCVLGLLLGFGLPSAGAGIWPAATLFLGVACGTSVFLGEQAEGAFKFWGDQRLPVGWLWLRRSALWAGVGAVVGVLMFVTALLHAGAEQTPFPSDPGAIVERLLGLSPGLFGLSSGLLFIGMWAAYGFAFGQLCCLVWRKSAVAVVVAVMTSAGVASLWVPSLLAGGLHPLAVLGVPLLLLGACRLSLWDWVTDRLRTRPAVMLLAGGVALASVWLAANFALRVVEMPGGGEPFDREALQARLTPEEGKPGQKIREALELQRERGAGPRDVGGMAPAPPPPGVGANPPVGPGGRGGPGGVPPGPGGVPPGPAVPQVWPQVDFRPDFREQIGHVIELGWTAADPEFEKWLDKMTAEPWGSRLAEGANMRPGVFINPSDASEPSRKSAILCREAIELLTVQALRFQARGADDKALEHLMTALALSRHMRHQAPQYCYLQGVEAERVALVGLDHWLQRVGRKPKLLQQALDGLIAHEAVMPPITDVLEAEYARYYGKGQDLGTGEQTVGRASGDVATMEMQIPWEAERARRLTQALFAGRRRMAEAGEVVPWTDDDLLADWLPEPGGTSRERMEGLVRSSWLAVTLPVTAPAQRAGQLGECRARAALLQLAAALYQCEHGKAPASLDDLVPGVLPQLPEDPFTRQSFGYRVSTGERITWRRRLPGGGEEFVREAPQGQGIIWSAGPDGNDDGGTRQWEGSPRAGAGRDMIFLVPRVQ